MNSDGVMDWWPWTQGFTLGWAPATLQAAKIEWDTPALGSIKKVARVYETNPSSRDSAARHPSRSSGGAILRNEPKLASDGQDGETPAT